MDDRPYLTPAELDFRRDESVTALGDGRYVVATDADGDAAADADEGRFARTDDRTARTDDRIADDDDERTARTDGSPSDAADESDPNYFVDVDVRTDEGRFDARFESDDIGAVCASMLRWYARRVSPDDDPQKVLSVLLARSDFEL